MSKREEIQEEAYQESLKHLRCTLAISMRLGKTRIGCRRLEAAYKQDKDFKAIIAAPKLSIFQSWKDELRELDLEYLLDNITFSTFRSLPKLGYHDLVILDEIHSITPSLEVWLGFQWRILGLTGTPPRKGTDKYKLINKYAPVRYTYLTSDAVEDKILNDYQILVHMIPIGETKNVKNTNKKTGGVYYTSEKESYNYWGNRIRGSKGPKDRQINSVMRMKAMQGFPSKVNYTKKLLKTLESKTIVFANTIEQAENISPFSYNSKNKDSEINLKLFKEGSTDIMSCVQQISEGITIPGCDTAVVLHSYGNEKKFLQRFARCLSLAEGELATVHVLCTKGTVDEEWVKSGLADLDPTKIKYVEFEL